MSLKIIPLYAAGLLSGCLLLLLLAWSLVSWAPACIDFLQGVFLFPAYCNSIINLVTFDSFLSSKIWHMQTGQCCQIHSFKVWKVYCHVLLSKGVTFWKMCNHRILSLCKHCKHHRVYLHTIVYDSYCTFVFVILLNDWQHDRFVHTSITTNA